MTLLQNVVSRMEFLLDFRVLLTKRPWKPFVRLKFKICGNEYSLLTNYSTVQHSI